MISGTLWRVASAVLVSALLPSAVGADVNRPAEKPQTYIYKTVGKLEIKVDVFRPTGFSGQRPVLVWLHGGALMAGHRSFGSQQWPFIGAILAAGVTVVSPDYRLAPETKLPDLIGDVEDAFRWVREKGPALFMIDPDRLAVAGQSAGGYLTLTAGYRVKPRPRVLVSYWGYGDLIGAWYSEPSTQPRHTKVKISVAEAYKAVSGPPVANGADRPPGQEDFYLYCRQQGIWPQEVSGWDPHRNPEKFYPYMPVKNITPEYPPTLLVHGLKDTDVPAENSFRVAAELERNGVEHRLITDPQAEHGSDWSPGMKERIDRAAVDFILAHLN